MRVSVQQSYATTWYVLILCWPIRRAHTGFQPEASFITASLSLGLDSGPAAGGVCTVQARQFGTSPFLQTNDYQAASQLSFTNGHTLSATQLNMTLSAAAVSFLSRTEGNQFRITMTPDSFTNHNGMLVTAQGGNVATTDSPSRTR
jgi:hypothetical protein